MTGEKSIYRTDLEMTEIIKSVDKDIRIVIKPIFPYIQKGRGKLIIC